MFKTWNKENDIASICWRLVISALTACTVFLQRLSDRCLSDNPPPTLGCLLLCSDRKQTPIWIESPRLPPSCQHVYLHGSLFFSPFSPFLWLLCVLLASWTQPCRLLWWMCCLVLLSVNLVSPEESTSSSTVCYYMRSVSFVSRPCQYATRDIALMICGNFQRRLTRS